ncbi:MAG: DUF2073 domain-containing protein [Thermoplasmata archaeon]|nr:MAG: DUF2073 domain-containing protein [Thermoplasmata archaeon]
MAGININLISIERLTNLSSRDKIRFILHEVKKGNVLVLEQGLTAEEEAELIKTTMSNIDQDTFIGIEMQSYSQEDVRKGSWLSKLLRRKQPPRMSVIGPAALLKTVHKDGNMIQAMILTKETIVGEKAKGQKREIPPPPKSVSNTNSGQAAVQPKDQQSTGTNAESPESKTDETPSKEEENKEGK